MACASSPFSRSMSHASSASAACRASSRTGTMPQPGACNRSSRSAASPIRPTMPAPMRSRSSHSSTRSSSCSSVSVAESAHSARNRSSSAFNSPRNRPSSFRALSSSSSAAASGTSPCWAARPISPAARSILAAHRLSPSMYSRGFIIPLASATCSRCAARHTHRYNYNIGRTALQWLICAHSAHAAAYPYAAHIRDTSSRRRLCAPHSTNFTHADTESPRVSSILHM